MVDTNHGPHRQKDEHLSQEWFHGVDGHLIQTTFLDWIIDVDIRAIIPEPGVVKCGGAAIDRAFDDTSDGRADPFNKADVFQDYARTPGTYDQLEHIAQGIDLVASLEALKHANIKGILVRKLKSDLLSGTWLLTRFSRFIIGPIMLFKAAAPRSAGVLLLFFLSSSLCTLESYASAGHLLGTRMSLHGYQGFS